MGDKKSISTIVKMLRLHDTDVRERFKITEIGVFGSYSRGEQREDSDIDILVEFERGYKTFDNYMELCFPELISPTSVSLQTDFLIPITT